MAEVEPSHGEQERQVLVEGEDGGPRSEGEGRRRSSLIAESAREVAVQMVLSNTNDCDQEEDEKIIEKQLLKASKEEAVTPTTSIALRSSFARKKTSRSPVRKEEEDEKKSEKPNQSEKTNRKNTSNESSRRRRRTRLSVLAARGRQVALSQVLDGADVNVGNAVDDVISVDSIPSQEEDIPGDQHERPTNADVNSHHQDLKYHQFKQTQSTENMLIIPTKQNQEVVNNNRQIHSKNSSQRHSQPFSASSSSQETPGAFRIRPFSNNDVPELSASAPFSTISDDGEQQEGQTEPPPLQRQILPSEELISAFVVDDEEQQQNQNGPNEEQEEKVLAHAKIFNKARVRRFRIFFLCLGLLLLVVVVVLSVLLRRGGPLPPSLAPSFSPSASPSFSSDGILQLLESQGSTFDNAVAITTDRTPQFRAAQWILSHTESNSDLLDRYSNAKVLQRYALAVIYFTLDGSNWFNNTNWLDVNVDECDWYFSADLSPCRDDGILLSLALRQNFLRGSLPLEVALLTNIRSLDLATNELTGLLPSSLGDLFQLETIDMSSNFINGFLEPSLGRLQNLRILELANNQIQCERTQIHMAAAAAPLPNQQRPLFSEWNNLTNLLVLSLRDNPLRVTDFECFLPTEIGYLSSLQRLDLRGTTLSGSLPTEVGQLTSLVRLYLPTFYHVPFLPTELGRLSHLVSLDLSGANLGYNLTIPTEIGLMTSLDLLNLSGRFGGSRKTGFLGTLPTEIGLLSNLKVLNLSRTRINGTVPTELGRLQSIESLAFEDTEFTGTLPFLGQLNNSLELLDFSDVMRLRGTLPDWIGSLTRLTHLALRSTGLSGPLPSSLFNLTNLNVLRLALTRLTGDIEDLACNADGSPGIAEASVTVGFVTCGCCVGTCKFLRDGSVECHGLF